MAAVNLGGAMLVMSGAIKQAVLGVPRSPSPPCDLRTVKAQVRAEVFASRPWRNWLQTRVEIPLMLHGVCPPSGGWLVELGCGRGVALASLFKALQPQCVVGVDLDAEAVELARHALGQLDVEGEILCADVASLPIPDASVRVVVDFGTCYHVADPESVIAEVQRVLEPGGVFVHESPLAQCLAHPRRSTARRLPWSAAPELRPLRSALLWSSRQKMGSSS